MSVTFTAAVPHVGFTISCGFHRTVYPTYPEALEAVKAHGPHACDAVANWREAVGDGWYEAQDEFHTTHGEYPDMCEMGVMTTPVYAEESPNVNVSESNARMLLETLGYVTDDAEGDEWGLGGSATAEDFLGRILVARALDPGDPGRPVDSRIGANGATLIDCGRRAGYVGERLEALQTLAEWAIAHDTTIQWG